MPPSLALRSWRCTEKTLGKPVFLRLTARAFCGASPVRRGAAGHDRREAAPSKGNASPRVYDRMPLERATLHIGTSHPLPRVSRTRWLREPKLIEVYRILQGTEATDEYLRSPIRATTERGTPFRRRLTWNIPEYPLLSKLTH